MDVAMSQSLPRDAEVAIIGMGYVGLTLASALAQAGIAVIGCEANPHACAALNQGRVPFFEPGLPEALEHCLGKTLEVRSSLPPRLPPVVIVCVGTPVDDQTKQPDFRQLQSAVEAIAERLEPDTLVIIRSTVPTGTCHSLVLPQLRRRVAEPLLAFCPERTIQGKALEELRMLPQIVGGLTEQAALRARDLFSRLTPRVRLVSSLEAAEIIKLICNAHTDLIYGFGNQIALIAEALGLDAAEVIAAANADYPRPDLSKPGFVGGSCLVKDPYLLAHSVKDQGMIPPMVMAARRLNESMPAQVAQRVLDHLRGQRANLAQAKVLLTGLAYKGQPETDDMRGGPAPAVLEVLRGQVARIVGHDFVVMPERIGTLGVEPVALEEGFADADAVLVLNNHCGYLDVRLSDYLPLMRRPGVLYDVWGIFQDQAGLCRDGITYMRLGHG